MSNSLVISDLHINDYSRFNIVPRYWLNLYQIYADRVIEIAKLNNCDTLIIAGDLLDRAINRNYILHVAKLVLDKFSSHFDSVLYIKGQHDRDSNGDSDIEDSVLPLISKSNIHYVNKKILNIQGNSYAFMDYYKVQDLSWIESKVDFFIGHVTIDERFGQKIDTSKFTQGVCGDIHQPVTVGNLMSVGCQIQRNLGDAIDGTCVVIDSLTRKCNRVLIDPDRELFMRLEYTFDRSTEGYSNELNKLEIPKYYRVYSGIKTKSTQSRGADKSIEFNDVNSLISEITTKLDLNEIHDEVVSLTIPTPGIDFKFEVQSMRVRNFRSIEYLDLDFNSINGVLFIHGENGSGKSSIIYALLYALQGGDFKEEIKEGAKYIMVEVTLNYQGLKYRIQRSTDGTNLMIDDKLVDYKTKTDCEKDIPLKLPFLKYLDSFFFDDQTINIMSSYSAERRIELLSTYFNLSIIKDYSQTASRLKEVENTHLVGLNNKLLELNSKRSVLESLIESNRVEFDESDLIASKLALSNELKMSLDSESLNSKVSKDELIIESVNLINELNSDYSILTGIKSKIDASGSLELILGKKVVLDETKFNNASLEIKSLKESLDRSRLDLAIKHSVKNNLKVIECNNCGNTINHSIEGIVDPILLDASINELNLSISSIESKIKELDNFLTEYRSSIDLNLSLDRQYTELKSLIELYELRSSNYSMKFIQYNELTEKIKLLSAGESLRPSSVVSIELNEVEVKLLKLEVYKTSVANLESFDLDNPIIPIELGINQVKLRKSKLETYEKSFSNSGEVYRLTLEHIVSSFDEDRFKYTVSKSTYRNKEYNDFYVSLSTDGVTFRRYSRLSKGQKTLCDLHFISKLITGTGLVVFDEILKFLSIKNQNYGAELIKSINSNLKLITSQVDCNYFDHRMNCSHDGINTTISME